MLNVRSSDARSGAEKLPVWDGPREFGNSRGIRSCTENPSGFQHFSVPDLVPDDRVLKFKMATTQQVRLYFIRPFTSNLMRGPPVLRLGKRRLAYLQVVVQKP